MRCFDAVFNLRSLFEGTIPIKFYLDFMLMLATVHLSYNGNFNLKLELKNPPEYINDLEVIDAPFLALNCGICLTD